MADQKLIDYIKQQLEQGKGRGEIQKTLIDAGWQEQAILEAFNIVSGYGGQNQNVPSPTPQIPSPETPSFTLEYAGFGRRFLAYWVDFIILFPIGLVVQQMMEVNPFAVFQAQTLEQLQQVQQSGAGGLPTIVSLALALAFFLIMWVNFDGATPGKKLMAIKIVKADGSKITYPVAFARYIGYFLSSFVFLLGYLWIIWDKKKQGWHDKIAGTVVVKTSEQPKTFLAVVLAMIAILAITGYMGASMFQGLRLGIQGAESKKQSLPSKYQQSPINLQLETSSNSETTIEINDRLS